MDKLNKLCSLFVLILTFKVTASTLFMPDSDTAALISLVSNTTSTVSNTLKILEVAKKASQQMDKYNSLAMRRFFIARRIEQQTRDIIAATKMNPRGLRQLNYVMLSLKLNLKGLRSSIDLLGQDIFDAENFTKRFYQKLSNSEIDSREAYNQEISSASSGTMAKHVQNTAINTALTSKILTKIRQDNLDYQTRDLALKKDLAKKELISQRYYLDWIGLQESLKTKNGARK